MPKVSICVPTYNQLNFLKRNLDSIVIQCYSDYEVIITDDTVDNSVKDFVLNYLIFFGDKLKYFKNSIRLGTPENWNEAIRKSSGNFIKILHHDDSFSNENSLLNFVRILENNPRVDFAFSATFVNSEEHVHKISSEEIEFLKKNPLHLIINNLIGAPSTTIFRNFSNIFFDQNLKWLVDTEFYLRYLKRNNFSFIYSSDILITTCSGESHQVTDECIDDRVVLVYEHLYVLQTFYSQKEIYGSKALKKIIIRTIEILDKFKIGSVQDIRNCGYHGRISNSIKIWLTLNNFSSSLSRLYLRILWG